MIDISKAGTFPLGDRVVKRLGYGAMQLAGPGVFGPPKDHGAAMAVLREAVASGVNHIDTSDYYGPHVTNKLIREALHPYPDDLVIVTKIGARPGDAQCPRRSAAPGRRASHWTEQRHLQSDRAGAADLRHRLRAESVQCGASRGRRPNRRACPRRRRLCAVLSAWRLH